MAMIFYICNILLASILKKEKKLIYISASAVTVFAGTVFISVSILYFAKIVSSPATVIMFTITTVILPLVMVFTEKIKEKRNEKT